MGDVKKVWDEAVGVVEDVVDIVEEDPLNLFLPYAVTKATIDLTVDLITPEIPNLPGMPGSSMPGGTSSPTYRSDNIGNTISEGIWVARCYGRCKIGGNKLRFSDPDDASLKMIVAHCIGPVQGIVILYVNDVPFSAGGTWSHSVTEYTGTRTQTPDARFSAAK